MFNRLESNALGDFSGSGTPFNFFAGNCNSFAIAKFLGEDVVILSACVVVAAGGSADDCTSDCVAVTCSRLSTNFA
jgi:hypothetical protein